VNTEVLDFIFKAVELGLIPFVGYLIKKLSDISEEMKALRTVMIGIDGRNGIRSRLIRLERRLERLLMNEAGHNNSGYTSEMETDD
jgi:hypothetical protein